MAPHSSTLAWKIPWMEEPGGLQSMGSLRVGHDWATSLSLFTFMHWRRKWQPTPVFLPGESQGRGSLVGFHLWGCRVGHDWSDLAAAAAGGTLGNSGPRGKVTLAPKYSIRFQEGKFPPCSLLEAESYRTSSKGWGLGDSQGKYLPCPMLQHRIITLQTCIRRSSWHRECDESKVTWKKGGENL